MRAGWSVESDFAGVKNSYHELRACAYSGDVSPGAMTDRYGGLVTATVRKVFGYNRNSLRHRSLRL